MFFFSGEVSNIHLPLKKHNFSTFWGYHGLYGCKRLTSPGLGVLRGKFSFPRIGLELGPLVLVEGKWEPSLTTNHQSKPPTRVKLKYGGFPFGVP